MEIFKFFWRDTKYRWICLLYKDNIIRDNEARRFNEFMFPFLKKGCPGPRWLFWLYQKYTWGFYYLTWPIRYFRG